ncbi:ATP-dependent RNA helicase dbp6 [Chytridiales sp. JEL 0842]|nr:ATP-dependent RNA helicase dbp6 [Chytridiales sp. JEL 0842]
MNVFDDLLLHTRTIESDVKDLMSSIGRPPLPLASDAHETFANRISNDKCIPLETKLCAIEERIVTQPVEDLLARVKEESRRMRESAVQIQEQLMAYGFIPVSDSLGIVAIPPAAEEQIMNTTFADEPNVSETSPPRGTFGSPMQPLSVTGIRTEDIRQSGEFMPASPATPASIRGIGETSNASGNMLHMHGFMNDDEPPSPTLESFGISSLGMNLIQDISSSPASSPSIPHITPMRRHTEADPNSIFGNLISRISDAEFETLPSYISAQFTCDTLNDTVTEINEYITDKRFSNDFGVGNVSTFSVEELADCETLDQAKIKAAIVALMHLNRIESDDDGHGGKMFPVARFDGKSVASAGQQRKDAKHVPDHHHDRSQPAAKKLKIDNNSQDYSPRHTTAQHDGSHRQQQGGRHFDPKLSWKEMKGKKKRWAEEIEREIDQKRAASDGTGASSDNVVESPKKPLRGVVDERAGGKLKKKRGGKKARLEKEKWMKARDLDLYGSVARSVDAQNALESVREPSLEADSKTIPDQPSEQVSEGENAETFHDAAEDFDDHENDNENQTLIDEDAPKKDVDTHHIHPERIQATIIPFNRNDTKAKPSKVAGLPDWLIHPITISPVLTKSEDCSILNPDLGLSPKTIARLQNMSTTNGDAPITHLFPVQQAVIPRLLKSRYAVVGGQAEGNDSSHMRPLLGDLCVSAPTGSGKTLSYVLPILESLENRIVTRLRALIVVPTRDLAIQVKSTFDALLRSGHNGANGIKVGMVTGSTSFKAEQKGLVDLPRESNVRHAAAFANGQISEDSIDVETTGPGLGSSKIDVLIATPGRLTDHLKSTKGFTLNHLRYLVMDEADRLLNQNYQGWLDLVLKAAAGVDIQGQDSSLYGYDVKKKVTTGSVLIERESETGKFWKDMGFHVDSLGLPLHTTKKLNSQYAVDKVGDELGSASWSTYHKHTRLQKLLFSATLTRNPEKIASLHLHNPVYIAVSSPDTSSGISGSENLDLFHPDRAMQQNADTERYVAPPTLSEFMIVASDTASKPLLLLHLLFQQNLKGVLIFTKSVEAAHRLSGLINLFASQRNKNSIETTSKKPTSSKATVVSHAITSELTPAARGKLLQQFSQGTLPILTCSDVASRGLDLGSSVTAVINYDAPLRAKTYVHRVGRTARAGREGSAYSIVEVKEAYFFKKAMAAVGRVEEEVVGADGEAEKKRKTVKRLKVAESLLGELEGDYEVALGSLGDIVHSRNVENGADENEGDEAEEEADAVEEDVEEDINDVIEDEDSDEEELPTEKPLCVDPPKEDPLRCLDISKQKFGAGQSEAAVKFARKSLALCDTSEAQQWLEFLEKHAAKGPSGASSSAKPEPSSSSSSNPRASSSSSSSKESEPSRPYTPEQVAGIKRIKACKAKGDLYAILGLEKGCSDSDIKKAYRKLALQFHPDKCGAPGTDEAFKAIGHAFAVLGDEGKKEQYDRFGVDPESSGRGGGGGGGFSRGGGGHPFAQGGFGEEISPEDLFNMFFGGDLGGGGIHFRSNFGGPAFRTHSTQARRRQAYQQAQRNANNQQGGDNNRMVQLVQLLPIIVLLLFTFLSNLFDGSSMENGSETSYAWEPTRVYSQARTTEIHNVGYYVNPKVFARGYSQQPRKLKMFEDAIEMQHYRNLQYRCRQEQEYKAALIAAARGPWLFGKVDESKLKVAEAFKMANCEALVDWDRISREYERKLR